jgi:nitrite reductase/ring-hydroxylating ferredoxin subunit
MGQGCSSGRVWVISHQSAWEARFMSKHVVATVSEIPPGQRKLVTVRGRSIAVFNLDGEFFGLFNRCPHQGGPMCEGILTGLIQSDEPGHYEYSRPGEILRCPWHGWEFDVKTGQSFCDPSKISVRNYPMEVVPGQMVVQGPYVAETLPVTVEEQYVIVEMA